MKKLFPIIGGILTLVIIVGVVIALNFSSYAKSTAEKIASSTLGVAVNIGSLEINIKDKSIDIKNLEIDNPSGFKQPQAMAFPLIRISADSLAKDMLIFDEIIVDGSKINLEVLESGTNLTKIHENVKNNSKPDAKPEKDPIKVIIRDLNITNTTLEPHLSMVSGAIDPVKLPNIRMQGIGEKQKGVLAAEAVSRILNRVVNTSINTAAKSGMLEGLAGDKLKELQSSFNISGSLSENLGKDVKSLGSGIKNMFGGN